MNSTKMEDTKRPKINSCSSQELKASKQTAASYFLHHTFTVRRANNFRKLSRVSRRAQHQSFPPFTIRAISRTRFVRTVSKARFLSLDSAPHTLCLGLSSYFTGQQAKHNWPVNFKVCFIPPLYTDV